MEVILLDLIAGFSHLEFANIKFINHIEFNITFIVDNNVSIK